MAFLLEILALVLAYLLLKLADLIHPTGGDVRVLLILFLVFLASAIIGWGQTVYVERRRP